MSSLNSVDLLKDVLEQTEKHRKIYSFIDVVNAGRVVKQADEWHYHNLSTTVRMLHSGSVKPWQRRLDRDNLTLSCIITVDDFCGALRNLIGEYTANADKYQSVFQPCFNPRELVESDKAKKQFKIDLGVNVWQTIKEGSDLTDSKSLKLECDKPAGNAAEAVQSYFQEHDGNAYFRDVFGTMRSLLVLAPMYYAKIDFLELKLYEAYIKVKRYIVDVKELELKYVAERWSEDNSEWHILEAKTVPATDEYSQTIGIKELADRVTVSLCHVDGYEIDSRTANNTVSAWERVSRYRGAIGRRW